MLVNLVNLSTDRVSSILELRLRVEVYGQRPLGRRLLTLILRLLRLLNSLRTSTSLAFTVTLHRTKRVHLLYQVVWINLVQAERVAYVQALMLLDKCIDTLPSVIANAVQPTNIRVSGKLQR